MNGEKSVTMFKPYTFLYTVHNAKIISVRKHVKAPNRNPNIFAFSYKTVLFILCSW